MSAEVKEGYKQSEAKKIPADWNILPLQDGVTLLSGHHVLAQYCNTDGHGIPYLTGPSDFPAGVIQHSKYTTKPTTICRKSDILVTVKGSGAGALTRADDAYCISRQLMAVRVNEWDADFIYAVLQNESAVFGAAATGLIPGLSRCDILKTIISIPPFTEQRAIATALSDMDALISGLDQLIAKKRDIKQATMQQLLTGQTRLPGFSGEWEVKSLGDLETEKCLKLFRGKVISKKDIEKSPGNYPIYSSSVKENGVFGYYGEFMLDEELITWSVDGGGHFFYRQKHKFSVTNVCGYLRVGSPRINCRFLAFQLQFLHSRMLFDYSSKAHPSVIRKAYEIMLPRSDEQSAIASTLSDMDSEISILEARCDKARQLKQGMMQELLTGRIRLI